MPAIMNVERWLWARRIWRWQNEAVVDRLARESLRRERSSRGPWAMKKPRAGTRGARKG